MALALLALNRTPSKQMALYGFCMVQNRRGEIATAAEASEVKVTLEFTFLR
jgi:hypothetical protein